MGTTNDFGVGWAMPAIGVTSRKAHYYTAGFRGASLCGKYVMLGGLREDHTHESPDNCLACRRKLATIRPDLNVKLPRRVRVELVETISDGDGWAYARKGERGWVEGMDSDRLDAQAKRGGSVDVGMRGPKRRLLVKAASLRALNA